MGAMIRESVTVNFWKIILVFLLLLLFLVMYFPSLYQGLLFVVLSHPHAKESESCGSPAFRVVAFNPRTGRSAGGIFCCLPPGCAGRRVPGAGLGWLLGALGEPLRSRAALAGLQPPSPGASGPAVSGARLGRGRGPLPARVPRQAVR